MISWTWTNTQQESSQKAITTHCVAVGKKESPNARTHTGTWRRWSKIFFRGRYERQDEKKLFYDIAYVTLKILKAERHTTKCHRHRTTPRSQSHLVATVSRRLHLGNISQEAPTQEARIGCKRNTSSSEASATQTSALRSALGWFFTVSTLRFIRSASDDFVGKENFSVSIFHIFSFFSPVHFVNSSLTHDVPTGSIANFHSFWPRIESRIKRLLQSTLSMDNRVGF